MKYSNIWLYIATLTACLLIGAAGGQDRSMNEPGIAGMLQWLDQPVPNFPWYTTGGSFYSQAYSETMFSPFTQYYTTTGMPVVGGMISSPARFDITQKIPSSVYYGSGVGLPYTQYVSTEPSGANSLWVQGPTNWTQYVVAPVGTWLQLVANAPVGGPAGFYEIVQTNARTVKYNIYQFNQGYNTMNFNAEQIGRHMMYFVVNNQPSNVVIVDVFAQAPAGQNYYTPNGPTSTLNGPTTYTSGPTTTTSNGLTTSSDDQTIIIAMDTEDDKPGNAEGHTGAPGITGDKPGNAEGHTGAPGITGDKPGNAEGHTGAPGLTGDMPGNAEGHTGAPGLTGDMPGNAEGHTGAPGITGDKPGNAEGHTGAPGQN